MLFLKKATPGSQKDLIIFSIEKLNAGKLTTGAKFGMMLQDSQFKGNESFEYVIEMAQKSKGYDEEGY